MTTPKYIWEILANILILALCLTSCATPDKGPPTPESRFQEAKATFDDGAYDLAIQQLGEFKSRHPYSNYAILADLYIADSYFKLDEFSEAVASYTQFAKLHPKHPKADYAMFRIGESYWVDAPEAVDREQDLTQKAIDSWQRMIAAYPNSPYVGKAKEYIKRGQERIARSYEFIAKFYCKMEKYHACAFKYLQIVKKFSGFKPLYQSALQNAAFAFDKLYEQKKADPDSDKNLYFKSLSLEELKNRAATLRKVLADSRAST